MSATSVPVSVLKALPRALHYGAFVSAPRTGREISTRAGQTRGERISLTNSQEQLLTFQGSYRQKEPTGPTDVTGREPWKAAAPHPCPPRIFSHVTSSRQIMGLGLRAWTTTVYLLFLS